MNQHRDALIRLSGDASAEETSQPAHCELLVRGMDCPSCAEQITRALKELEGIHDVQVDVVGGKVRVDYAHGKLARGDLAGAVRRVGFQVDEGETRRAAFTVREMDCSEEVRQIEHQLGKMPGVSHLEFDLLSRRLVVEGAITAGEVQRALHELGMTAESEGEQRRKLSFWERRGRLVLASCSGALLIAALVGQAIGFRAIVTIPLFALAYLAGGWFVVPRAWRAVRHRTLDMNFLMLLAAVGAAGIGEWAEGASVLFLFSIAQLLESWSMDRARNAIKALMELSPTEAVVRRAGREETVSPDEVQVGETLVIRPGQKIPLDGEVLRGGSTVNQAPITGESIPVDKMPGDAVFAGSINEHGLLEVRVTKHVGDTTLARIIHAVEVAQTSRAPSQSFVDRFARIYTPSVVLAAVLIFLVPPLVGLGAWSDWFYRALAMLVIACPCALVISTPVSIVSGLAGAARGGVLIKGGLHLENAGAVTVVAFDKTGTLTAGQPVVSDVVPLNELEPAAVLRLAATLEQGSEHSLARAIVTAAREQNLSVPPAHEFQALIGRGVRARIDGEMYYLGNERLFEEHAVSLETLRESLDWFERKGKTTVILGNALRPLGLITLVDQPRPEAAASIAALHGGGIRSVLMLTGDNHETARAIAESLAMDDYRAELLPEDKVRVARELEEKGERVAFIGDGVNDAPALASATVGMAMGAIGTDVALETADIALMADDLSRVGWVLNLGRRTLRVIKQNIAFSLAVKLVFLALAISGWATLWMAVVADMGASLLVIFNGLRLLRTR